MTDEAPDNRPVPPAQQVATMARTFLRLTEAKRELKLRTEKVAMKIELMGRPFKNALAAAGMSKVVLTMADKTTQTVYLNRKFGVKLPEGAKEDASIKAGIALEMKKVNPELLKYDFNLNSVSSYVSDLIGANVERKRDGAEEVPLPAWVSKLTMKSSDVLSSRKGTASKSKSAIAADAVSEETQK